MILWFCGAIKITFLQAWLERIVSMWWFYRNPTWDGHSIPELTLCPCQRMAGLQGQVRKGKCLRPNPFCCTCVWVKILQALPMSRGYQSWTAVANGATLSQMFLSFWGPHLQLLQPCCMQNTSTLIKNQALMHLKIHWHQQHRYVSTCLYGLEDLIVGNSWGNITLCGSLS